MPVSSQATRPVRLGIIGCGRVLSGPYRPVLDRLLGEGAAEVTVACDVVAEREAFVRDAFGAKRFTSNHRDVLEADDVDVVLVLTPPTSHAGLTIEALEAGKHVLVEKPVALDLADASRVLRAWQVNPGHLVCAPFATLSPTYGAIGGDRRAGRWSRLHGACDLRLGGARLGDLVLPGPVAAARCSTWASTT